MKTTTSHTHNTQNEKNAGKERKMKNCSSRRALLLRVVCARWTLLFIVR
jgi:hypothetical protein